MTCSINFIFCSVSVILVPCEDTHANCGANPGWPASWCGDSNYPYVDTNCLVLCNQCSKSISSYGHLSESHLMQLMHIHHSLNVYHHNAKDIFSFCSTSTVW